MNSTTKHLFYMYELSYLINISACSILVMIGCVGGFFTLLVFWHAKDKPPKIGAQNYLTILIVTNSIFLILYWLINTAPLLITYFELDANNFINIINLNNFTCKFINYLCPVTRCMSTLLALAFSLERTFATFFHSK